MGLVRSLFLQLLLKTAILATVLVSLVAVMFLVFQVYLVSCPPSFTGDQCWALNYLPQMPPHNYYSTLTYLRASIASQYGLGQPPWVRVIDYYRLMLSSNYGYNIGNAVGGSVYSTVSTHRPYTQVIVLAPAIAVLAAGWLLRLAGRSGRSRSLSPISISAFLIPGVVVPGAFAWLLDATLHAGNYGWFNTFLAYLGPHTWYVPVGVATFLRSGLDFYWAALGAMWAPFTFLAIVGFLSLLTLRAFNRGRVYFLTAFTACLVSIISWALIAEPIYEWPGLGQAYYIGEASLNLPLQQAAAFEMSMFVIGTVFALFVIRDVVCFFARLLMYSGWNSRVLRWIASPPEPGTKLW